MRIALKIVKWLALVLMALTIAMFAINWSDQPPSAAALEMQSLLDQGSEIPDKDNAFVYAMGFTAPQGSDPVSVGVECIAKFNAAVHKTKINFDTDLKCDYDSPSKYKKPAITELLNTCVKANDECVDALQKNEHAIVKWLRDESWLLKRYNELLQRSNWHLTIELSPYVPFPHYGVIGDGRKMLLLKAWYLAGQGKNEEVQELLNKDAKFWRSVLLSSNLVLDKMVATAFLGKDFAFANLILRRLQEKGITPLLPDSWQVPFAGEELSLKRALAGEWAYMAGALREVELGRAVLMDGENIGHAEEKTIIDRLLDDLYGSFFLRQATQNEYAEILLRLVEMLDVPINKFSGAVQQKDSFMKEFNLYSLYNPIGHILVGVGMPAYSDYAERVYNLEGVRRATLATVQLRENGVGADQVASALDQSELKNPYDGKPFEWNAETKSIVFKGLGTGERSTHSFLY